MMDHPEFRADRCAHVGANPPNGGTGHAVAIHRQNIGGRYHFFDPNFGVYDFSRTNLIEAFVFLFGTAYPHWAGGGTSDNHPYEVAGRTKGTWSILKGNRVPAVAVVELPQSTTVVVEPVVRLLVAQQAQNIPVTTQTGPPLTGTRTGGQQPAGNTNTTPRGG